MALTRAMLKGMGLTEEQISAIIDEHTSVTTSLKEDIKKYKGDAEKLPNIQKELDDLRKDIAEKDWKGKYDREHEEYTKYKDGVTAEKKLNDLKSAYKKLLAECKVGDKHVDSILRVTDFSNMEIGEDGKLKDIDKLKETINADYSGFIASKETKGAGVENPPKGDDDAGKKTGRAAEIAAKYHENLYGKEKEA